MLQNTGDTEVTNLNLTRLCHENVLCLQISVQDLLIVDVLNGEGHLDEPIKNLILTIANYKQTIRNRMIILPFPIFF